MYRIPSTRQDQRGVTCHHAAVLPLPDLLNTMPLSPCHLSQTPAPLIPRDNLASRCPYPVFWVVPGLGALSLSQLTNDINGGQVDTCVWRWPGRRQCCWLGSIAGLIPGCSTCHRATCRHVTCHGAAGFPLPDLLTTSYPDPAGQSRLSMLKSRVLGGSSHGSVEFVPVDMCQDMWLGGCVCLQLTWMTSVLPAR